jgi:hypothetical protein
MKLAPKLLQYLSAIIIVMLFTGCGAIGPRIVSDSRDGFNTALLNSEEQQLLLNIVRMQYGDRPYFLGVSSINASNSLTTSGSAAATWVTKQTGVSFGVAPSVSYTDAPTLTFNPLQGEHFTRQILAPISMENIYLFLQSGWSVARVFRVLVQSIGQLDNAGGSTRPSTSHVPVYKDYVEFVHYLRQLQLAGDVAIGGEISGNIFNIDIMSDKQHMNTPRVKKMLRMLGIKKWHGKIQLGENMIPGTKDIFLPMVPRSFVSVLYYLSKSVELNRREIEQGITASVPVLPDGSYFDWSKVTAGMMKVYQSTLVPRNANVMVYYRNHWFYTADNDRDTKQTIALVEQLFQLQAGEMTGPQPLLTLSVK